MYLEEYKKRKLIFILAIIVVFFGILFVLSSFFEKKKPKEIPLTVWGFDSPEVIKPLFDSYNKNNLLKKRGFVIKFEYVQQDYRDYREKLIDAMAAGRGPDIFMIHNDWTDNFTDKIIPYGGKRFNPHSIVDRFVQVVGQDFVRDGKIYALPNSVETLVLYYNLDIFDQNNIPLPPKSWEEFKRLAVKLTKFDRRRTRIEQAGAAFGSADNIDKSADIFLAFLSQKWLTESKYDKKDLVAKTLLEYTSFASPYSENYVWDSSLHYSVDAFSEGKVAMFFDYPYQEKIIASKNPYLNFKIAPFPQRNSSNKINFPSYWGWAVSVQSKYPFYAWDFVLSLTNGSLAKYYFKSTNKPPALRELIATCIDDHKIGILCSQALTAKDVFYHRRSLLEKEIPNLLENLLKGKITLKEATDLFMKNF